jgi:hypothetical protein
MPANRHRSFGTTTNLESHKRPADVISNAVQVMKIANMRPQPAKGPYFAITPAQFIACTREWRLETYGSLDSRELRNPADFNPADGQPLAMLRPRRKVIVYSLPDGIDRPFWHESGSEGT